MVEVGWCGRYCWWVADVCYNWYGCNPSEGASHSVNLYVYVFFFLFVVILSRSAGPHTKIKQSIDENPRERPSMAMA